MSLSFWNNKKGSSVDMYFSIALTLALGIMMLIAIFSWDQISNVNTLWDNPTGVSIRNNTQSFYNNADLMALLFYFSLHLAPILLAVFLRTYPFIYVAMFILILILPIIAAPISNAWEVVITDTNLITSANQLPNFNFIMQNLVFFELIWSVINVVLTIGLAKGADFL